MKSRSLQFLLTLAVVLAAGLAAAAEEKAAAQDTNREIYRWQVEKYKMLRKGVPDMEGFQALFDKNLQPQEKPKTQEEIYPWQWSEYPRLHEAFKERILRSKGKPPAKEGIYSWQWEDYPNLKKEFQGVLDEEAQYHHVKPFKTMTATAEEKAFQEKTGAAVTTSPKTNP